MIEVGAILFVDPNIIEDRGATKSATTDGIMTTIHKSFPFESIIGPLVNSHKFYIDSDEAEEFATTVMDRVDLMDPQQVVDFANQQVHGSRGRGSKNAIESTPVGGDGYEYLENDNMAADVDSDDLGFEE